MTATKLTNLGNRIAAWAGPLLCLMIGCACVLVVVLAIAGNPR